MAPLIGTPETRTLPVPLDQAQCSARVAAGAFARRPGSASRRAAASIAGSPWRGRGASAPVSRRNARYRLTVARPTPQVRAASPRGIPPATAPTIRSRRFSE